MNGREDEQVDVAGESTGRIPHRHSIATVTLGGTLGEKVAAASAAGPEGVELFGPDLIDAPLAPEEVPRRLADPGPACELCQPLRASAGASLELFRRRLRLARARFDVMKRLGARMALLCSWTYRRSNILYDEDAYARAAPLLHPILPGKRAVRIVDRGPGYAAYGAGGALVRMAALESA